VPGRRPQLGAKLVSSGALAPEALADALQAQRTELQGWRLGELLVHLGYVDQPLVEAFIKEQVHDAIWDLIKWVDGRWRFRKTEKTREDVAPPMEVAELLHELRERGAEWATISSIVHGPTAVPALSTRGGGSAETMLDTDAWSMLCKIDGERSLAELARDCGYTHFEAGQILVALVNAGLVDIDEDLDVEPMTSLTADSRDELYGATSVSSALVADAEASASASYRADEPDEPDDSLTALARLVSEVAANVGHDNPADADHEPEPEPAPVVLLETRARFNAGNDQSFAASIAKVSAALNDVLGPAPATAADPFEVPMDLRARMSPRTRTEEEERRTRARQAAAAELAAAHALAEALRGAQTEDHSAATDSHADVADVVDLAAVRREAEADRLAAEEAGRLEAERLAAEEAARLEAERLAAERLAAEETARREVEEAAERRRERRAAREAARQEEERLAAERQAAEEAARLEAERVAAERLEAERFAAEETARLEAERLAAEETARLEAERLAAEEAARLEAERVAAERLEAERFAAEEAARHEAERQAAEEAERQAAERAEAESEAWAEYWARQTREADAAAEATSLLVSLSAQPVSEPTPAPDPEPVVEPDRVDDNAEAAELREPAAVGGRGQIMYDMTDTAALLRELSSLGVDDDESPTPPAGPSPVRQVRPAAPEKKKKRGLFGF
jgi:hypothetical protein